LADVSGDQYSMTANYFENQKIYFRFKPVGLNGEGDFVYLEHAFEGFGSDWIPPKVTRLRLQGDDDHNQIFEGKSFIVEWDQTSWDVTGIGGVGGADNNPADQEFSHFEHNIDIHRMIWFWMD